MRRVAVPLPPITARAALAGALAGALLAAAVAPATLHAQNTVVAEVRIRVERGRTLVPVSLGSSGPFDLILDTGMGYDGILLFDTAGVDLAAIGALARVQIPGAGAGSASEGLSAAEGRFAVGTLAIEGQRVTLLTDARWRGRGTGGVIGTSLLGHYAVELDYDRGRMILYEPATFRPGEGWTTLDLTFRENRIPWLPIAVAAGDESTVPLQAYIDFASGEALELLERETNAFPMPVLTGDSTFGRGLSGDVVGRRGKVSVVRIGPFELHDVSVNLVPASVRSRQPRADAILAGDALRRFNVVFDYAHGKLHLRPNRLFGAPFP